MDAIITVDERQHIVLFNPPPSRCSAAPRDEALGAPLDRFIPAALPRRAPRAIGASATPAAPARAHGRRTASSRALRRDGEEFPIDASISQVDGGRRASYYTVILRDVTERVRGRGGAAGSREELRELARAASSSARAGEEPHRARAARRAGPGAHRAQDGRGLAARAARRAAEPSSPRSWPRCSDLLDGTVAATRRISADLRPLMLDDLGLAAGAEWLAQNFTSRTGIAVRARDRRRRPRAAPSRTRPRSSASLQESLTNIAQARARRRRSRCTLERDDGEVTLEVRGQRPRLRAGRPAPSRARSAWSGMRERAPLLGGEHRRSRARPARRHAPRLRMPLRAGRRRCDDPHRASPTTTRSCARA